MTQTTPMYVREGFLPEADPVYRETNKHTGARVQRKTDATRSRLNALGHNVDEVMSLLDAGDELDGEHAWFRRLS